MVVHVHDVGNLAYTGLLAHLTPHYLHLKRMGQLDQGLEVEAELMVHCGQAAQEREEAGTAYVKMTEQLTDVVTPLLTDWAGQR